MKSCAKCEVPTDTVMECEGCKFLYCTDCLPVGHSRCVQCVPVPESVRSEPSATVESAIATILASSAFAVAIQAAVEAAVKQQKILENISENTVPLSGHDMGHDNDMPPTVAAPSPKMTLRTEMPLTSTANYAPAPPVGALLNTAAITNAEIGGASNIYGTRCGNRSYIAEIEDSIRLEPVDKTQRAYRAGNTALPIVDDDCFEFFLFYTRYQESTAKCKFTPLENVDRLKTAVKGEALGYVQHLMGLPHKVDQVIEILHREFTRPRRLIATARQLANQVPTLKANLENCSQFNQAVTRVYLVLELMTSSYSDMDIMDTLVGKLPTEVCREWIRKFAEDEGGIPEFVQFVEGLTEESRRMPRALRGRKEHVHLQVADKEPPCPAGCNDPILHELIKCDKFNSMSVSQRWAVARRGKGCFNCLISTHVRRDCPHPSLCTHCGPSGGKHHWLLHHDRRRVQFARIPTPKGDTIFRVVPVTLYTNTATIDTYALMDNGSSVTLMEQSLADSLGISGPALNIQLTGTDGLSKSTDTQQVRVSIRAREGKSTVSIEALALKNLQLPRCTVTDDDLLDGGFTHLPIARFYNEIPRILIGLDNPQVTIARETILGKNDRLIASESPLGWSIEGKRSGVERDSKTGVFFVSPAEDKLESLITEYIEAENFGLLPDDCVSLESVENSAARQFLMQNTRFTGERYETRLLWQAEDSVLPYNYSMAMKRHRSFVAKMRKDRDLFGRVMTNFREYEQKGFVSRVTSMDVSPQYARNWTIPIFTVTSASKPDKIRLVWDAAAEFEGVSLNSCLWSGPDLAAPLINVLLRFRAGRVAVSGDIEQMFLQIEVKREDRSALQFLFLDADGHDALFQADRLPFGTTCSPTCAQYAKNLNAHRFVQTHPEAVFEIEENTYVDDWLSSFNTEEEAIERALQVKAIHASGGFNMRKWASNSPSLLRTLGCAPPTEQIEVSQNSCSTLGLQWCSTFDLFSFCSRGESLRHLIGLQRPTKRQVVQLAMSLYDPLGFAAFITIVPRMLMRDVWRFTLNWDDVIPLDLMEGWTRTVLAVEQLKNFRLARWHGTSSREVEIHVFCDASVNAIAAVAYVVFKKDGARQSSICIAKGKVAPLKSLSVPRLELEAAVMGVRLLEMVQRSKIWTVQKIVMWTDALDVLYWIRSHKRKYNQFVANRVGDILRRTDVSQWRWVPTDANPADWATKWNERSNLDLWLHGPPFLQEEEGVWPDSQSVPDTVTEEVRVMVVHKIDRPEYLPDPLRFSSWNSFLKASTFVRLFPDILRKRRSRGPVLPHEEEETRKIILRWVQIHLPDTQSGFVASLSPFLDPEDGLWRMKGRTFAATFLSYEERCPVILPRHHPVTALLVRHYHVLNRHELIDRALNLFRQGYVLERSRTAFNREMKNCPTCILKRARPAAPEMAVLPPCRLAVSQAPFTHCGIDAFGPFYVSRLRRREKWYGIIFVCQTSRAIYLELVESLSGESCIRALDSLAARRGPPAVFYCDNGTNFVYAAKRYRDLLGRKPEFVFNPPGAPHMGGSWERMIGLTKKALMALGLESPTSEERLRHLLLQAEFIINTRPLTEVPHDPQATAALTPMMVLNGTPAFKSERETNIHVMKEVKDATVQVFWERWTREYLRTIATRTKWRQTVLPLKPGDLVYVCDSDYRGGWRRGRITEVYADSTSGQVRRARVELHEDGERRVVLRPATRLAKLNISGNV